MSKENNGTISDKVQLSSNKDSIRETRNDAAPKLLGPSDLVVRTEYKNLYPMSEADFQKLNQSIEAEGQKVPITVNQRYEIIDGFGRTRSARELERKVLVQVMHFESLEEEKKLIHILNLARRHLSEYARIKVVVLDETFIKEQAHKRQIAGLRRGSSVPLVLNQTDGETGRTDQICADLAGVKLTRYRQVRDLIKDKSIPEQMELELVEGKAKLDKILPSFTSKINRQPKNIRQFRGETLVMSDKIKIIQGRFQDLNPTHLADGSLSMVFPTFDFSYKPKFAKDIATFASRYLKKDGFLVMNVDQESLGPIIQAVTKATKDLSLLYALPMNFSKEWQNLVACFMTHTVIYLIFGKWDVKDGPFLTYSFDEPISIDLGSDGKDHTQELKPELANPFAVDYLVRGLWLRNGRICDPLCGIGDTAIKFLERGLEIVAIEPDPAKFEAVKSNMERQLKETK